VGWLLFAAMLVGACSSSGGADRTGSTTVRSKGSTADSGGKEWPAYGHDLSNTRTNVSETKINATTASKLTKSWENDGLVGVSGTAGDRRGLRLFR
jgi:hypothetical protein